MGESKARTRDSVMPRCSPPSPPSRGARSTVGCVQSRQQRGKVVQRGSPDLGAASGRSRSLAPAQRNQLHGARSHMARNQDADWQAMKFSAWAHSSAPRLPSHILSLTAQARHSVIVDRVRSQQGVRECEGPPHNYSSSFPAGVHAPVFRLSAKVNKVEGCAWLYAHQSPDRSHSQRISNRCEGFITFLSLSAERGCDHLSGEQVRRKIPVFVKRGCGANTR